MPLNKETKPMIVQFKHIEKIKKQYKQYKISHSWTCRVLVLIAVYDNINASIFSKVRITIKMLW